MKEKGIFFRAVDAVDAVEAVDAVHAKE